MNIDDAARATQKYFVTWHGDISHKIWQVFVAETGVAVSKEFATEEQAQVACDHMNLVAVLEAIREPSEVMVAEGEAAYVYHPKNIWSEMIYALIAEVKNR